MDVKECENHIKWEPKICKMIRGFKIWPTNYNWITFDPLLGKKKTQKSTKLGILPIFWVAWF